MKKCFFCFFLILLFILNGYGYPREYIVELSESFQTGSYRDIAIQGDRVYTATDYGFDIVDVSDPDNPQLLARHPSLDNAQYIEAKDEFVYLADWSYGIRGFDVSDLENIREVWFYPPEPMEYGLFEQIKVKDDRLYACVWNRGVVIFDLADPGSPEYLGHYRDARLPMSIDFRGNIAYIASIGYPHSEIHIADLSDPDNLNAYNVLAVDNYTYGVSVGEDLLFVAHGDDGFSIYSLVRPTNPVRFRTIESEGWIERVTPLSDVLYVCASQVGLKVYDVSDPIRPEFLMTDTTFKRLRGLNVYNGERAFTTLGLSGLGVYDVSDPASPAVSGRLDLPKAVNNFCVHRGAVFLPRYADGLYIIDTGDPANPEVVSIIDSTGFSSVHKIIDDFLLVYSYNSDSDTSALQVWDISNPLEPGLVSWTGLEEIPDEIASSDFLMAHNYSGDRIEIWDISIPEDPEMTARIDDAGQTYIAMGGEYLYVNDRNEDAECTIYVYSLRDSQNPELAGEYALDRANDDYFYGLDVHGRYLYISHAQKGAQIFDAGNPESISPAGGVGSFDWMNYVHAVDTLLYTGDSDAGMRIFNLADEDGFAEVGWINTPGNPRQIEVENDIIYIADTYDFMICRFDSETGVIQTPVFANEFAIAPAYPNPFNSAVTIPLTLPGRSRLNMSIWDLNGRLVHSASFVLNAGRRAIVWNGSDQVSGTYLLNVELLDPQNANVLFKAQRKLTLIR